MGTPTDGRGSEGGGTAFGPVVAVAGDAPVSTVVPVEAADCWRDPWVGGIGDFLMSLS
jgi:hypothetical protein